MIVNRVSGLVLPYTTKSFVDGVLNQGRSGLLMRIVIVVLMATLIQALTSYALAQMISKAAQRMIAALRIRVQAHVGRLSISFFDANKTGQLVSRIMNDVEGVRNLIGTGMIDFFGSLVTAALAGLYLIHLNAMLTAIAAVVMLSFGLGMRKAFSVIRPLFRARPKISAEVAGRLTESLGGVRVIKGYNAEAREEKVFSDGIGRLLDNVLASVNAMSLMSTSSAVLMGLVSALIMYFGGLRVVVKADDHRRFDVLHDVSGVARRARFPNRQCRQFRERSSCRTGTHPRHSERESRGIRSKAHANNSHHSRRCCF